jgi:kynurenine formamidase
MSGDFDIPTDLGGVRDLVKRYSNWGRWGADDEKGTLNHIGPAEVAAAAALAREGRVFSLAIPLNDAGPQAGTLGRTNPVHLMLQDGGDVANGSQDYLNMQYTDDAVYMVLQCGTQWDAIAHYFFENQMYNGYGTDQVTSRGALRNGIEKVADKLIGRGVLLDLPRHRGVQWLAPGEPVHGSDLLECAAAQGVEIGRGDILLIRTGQMARTIGQGSWGDYCGGPAPGLSASCTPVLADREVAAIATDTWTVEVWPSEVPGVSGVMHDILIVGLGMTLGEIFDLEGLAEDCAADGRYEFLLAAPPLTVTGAVGSPINPLAVK